MRARACVRERVPARACACAYCACPDACVRWRCLCVCGGAKGEGLRVVGPASDTREGMAGGGSLLRSVRPNARQHPLLPCSGCMPPSHQGTYRCRYSHIGAWASACREPYRAGREVVLLPIYIKLSIPISCRYVTPSMAGCCPIDAFDRAALQDDGVLGRSDPRPGAGPAAQHHQHDRQGGPYGWALWVAQLWVGGWVGHTRNRAHTSREGPPG